MINLIKNLFTKSRPDENIKSVIPLAPVKEKEIKFFTPEQEEKIMDELEVFPFGQALYFYNNDKVEYGKVVGYDLSYMSDIENKKGNPYIKLSYQISVKGSWILSCESSELVAPTKEGLIEKIADKINS